MTDDDERDCDEMVRALVELNTAFDGADFLPAEILKLASLIDFLNPGRTITISMDDNRDIDISINNFEATESDAPS